MSASDLKAHLDQNLGLLQVTQFLHQDIVLVAERNAQLVGYIQFGRLENRNDMELRRLYVLSEFQNQHLGTQLIQAALAHPQLENAARIYLDVWEHNHGAQRFYKRFGFEVVGERKFKVESGAETDPDWIMLRSNSAPR